MWRQWTSFASLKKLPSRIQNIHHRPTDRFRFQDTSGNHSEPRRMDSLETGWSRFSVQGIEYQEQTLQYYCFYYWVQMHFPQVHLSYDEIDQQPSSSFFETWILRTPQLLKTNCAPHKTCGVNAGPWVESRFRTIKDTHTFFSCPTDFSCIFGC